MLALFITHNAIVAKEMSYKNYSEMFIIYKHFTEMISILGNVKHIINRVYDYRLLWEQNISLFIRDYRIEFAIEYTNNMLYTYNAPL